MSAPTEENKKPAGIESFLIVAYRSLRGRKSGVSYRERNLIDASAEKIKSMAENLSLTAVQNNSFKCNIVGLPEINPTQQFVLTQRIGRNRWKEISGVSKLTLAELVKQHVLHSVA